MLPALPLLCRLLPPFAPAVCFLKITLFLLAGFSVCRADSVVLTKAEPVRTFTLDIPQKPEKSQIYRSRLVITNEGSATDYVLLLPRWGEATLEWPDGAQKAGSRLPLSERALPFFQPAFRVNIPSGATIAGELRLKGELQLLTPEQSVVRLMPLETFYRQDRQRLLSQGLFLGVIVVMALYNLLIYLSVRDVSFLWFVLSILGIGLYLGFYYGFGIEYFWKSSPVWDVYCFSMIIPLTNITRIFFTRTYLHTADLLPRWDRALTALLVLESLIFASGAVSYAFRLDWLHTINACIGVVGTLVLSAMLLVGVAAFRKGYEPARYFVLASALFVIGAILFIVRELKLLPDLYLTRYAVQLGVVVQVVLFSLGLGNRLNQLQAELVQQKLERERLQQEEARQVELNRLKDKLLSVISHDLRNPLASFDSLFNLLTDHYDQLSRQDIDKLIRRARQNLEQQKTLLTNLLYWAKSQWAGNLYQPEPVNLTRLLERNLVLLQPAAQLKAINLRIDCPPDLAVYADRDMLDFIVRNLLDNAVKFSSANQTVHLNVCDLGPGVQLTVEDNGVGMKAEQLQAVLTSQAGISTRGTANEKGAGLGLVVCREFMELTGSDFTIDSQIGRGTVVRFSLPKTDKAS